MEQALGQPDFGSISGSFNTLSRQFALCGSLPAVDGGARLADRMDRMEVLLQQMSRTLQRVDEGLVGLTRRMDISSVRLVGKRRCSILSANRRLLLGTRTLWCVSRIAPPRITMRHYFLCSAKKTEDLLRAALQRLAMPSAWQVGVSVTDSPPTPPKHFADLLSSTRCDRSAAAVWPFTAGRGGRKAKEDPFCYGSSQPGFIA